MANTLILVHGFMDTSKRMAYLSRQLTHLGWKVLTPSLKPSDGSESIEVLAQQLNIYIQQNTTNNERIDLIGFSMGGLICRYYLQFLNGHARADRLISISTPHHGTFTAYLFLGLGIKQMQPGSAFLRNLNADVKQLKQLEYVSFYTPLDLVIIPAKSSVLQLGQTYKVYAMMHHWMVYHKGLLNKIILVLNSSKKQLT